MISGSAIRRSLLRRSGRFPRLRIEFSQSRHHFLCKEGNVRDGVFVFQETALAKHQQMAEAADAVAERLDLLVHLIRCAGKAGAALDQLLD